MGPTRVMRGPVRAKVIRDRGGGDHRGADRSANRTRFLNDTSSGPNARTMYTHNE